MRQPRSLRAKSRQILNLIRTKRHRMAPHKKLLPLVGPFRGPIVWYKPPTPHSLSFQTRVELYILNHEKPPSPIISLFSMLVRYKPSTLNLIDDPVTSDIHTWFARFVDCHKGLSISPSQRTMSTITGMLFPFHRSGLVEAKHLEATFLTKWFTLKYNPVPLFTYNAN